jgi:hypothetical protein
MNHRMATRVVIAGAALAVAVGISRPAAAHAGAPQTLLQRYQPVTVLDATEQFPPTGVASFVSDAALETQTAPDVWSVVDTTPVLRRLPAVASRACIDQGLSPCYRLNQRDCTPLTGIASTVCYHDDWLSPAPRSLVYGRSVSHRGQTLLQYWYFSYDDFYSYDYPPDDLLWQAHEGDWEMVTVLVRNGRPVTVGYSQHCTGERRPWAAVERWQGSTHPVVYVAAGSHANLFAAGEHPIAQQCIPPQAIALLQQAGLPLPRDHAHPAGVAYGPPGLAGVTPTGIRRVTDGEPHWMRFAGIWGQEQVFHAPPPIGTVVDGASPLTPPRQDSWRFPLRTLFSWPRSA